MTDGDQAAHLLGGDLLAAEHVGLDGSVSGRDLPRPAREEGGGGDVGGQALQVAGPVLSLCADAGGLSGASDGFRSDQRQRLELCRRLILRIGALEAVEAI